MASNPCRHAMMNAASSVLLTIFLVSGPQSSAAEDAAASSPAMKHYKNVEWNFELDVPSTWNRFPPVSSNSPFEVTRFLSTEKGNHALIVFRNPADPKDDPEVVVGRMQRTLERGGFADFVEGEVKIGSKIVKTLDFDKMLNGHPWYCRHYIVADGTLLYVLGFGTTDRDAMFPLYERMAQTFVANE